MNRRKLLLVFTLLSVFCLGIVITAQEIYGTKADKGGKVTRLRGRTEESEELRKEKESAKEAKRESAKKARMAAASKRDKVLEQITLPKDTTTRLTVRQVRINGNTLIATDELLTDIPSVYNASGKPLGEAESIYLYDLRDIRNVILNPGEAREVSTRTIQGFTQYLLSIHQRQNYAGIYVLVPTEAIKEGAELEGQLLPIQIIEVPISEIKITSYDIDHNVTEEGYLDHSLIREWSPVKVGEVANKKELDDFINLLNLDPDRYISATISQGSEPRTLNLGYDVFEISPWHRFVQIDNSGTEDIRWTPRIGLINTNLTGRDDRLTAMLQGPIDENPEHEYSVFGSYDFPLWTPRLRLNLFAGRNEFDIDGGSGIDFLGNGYFYGGALRFNAFQKDDWFFDLTSSLSREKSKVTSSLFPTILGSKVFMDLWSVGFDIHRRDDLSNTYFIFNRTESFGGSGSADFATARTGADPDFVILDFSAGHSRFLDESEIHKVLGSFKYVRPNARLVPAKMSLFGGMYTVRGYKESGIVADGGLLASVQYEYDLVKKDEAKEAGSASVEKKGLYLKKLSPLVFFDYGRAKIEDSVPGERGAQELYSVGLGLILELGEHVSAGAYYGYPLTATDSTDTKDGRLNLGFMVRW